MPNDFRDSMQIDKWFSCGGKIRYKKEQSAKNIIKQQKKKGKIISRTLTVYHCKICGGWHIGHNRMLMKKEKLEKDLNQMPKLMDGNTRIHVGFLNKHRKDIIFVFGDNNDRSGLGGQAAVARKVSNSYGFVTKIKPTHSPKDYYKPEPYKPVFERV